METYIRCETNRIDLRKRERSQLLDRIYRSQIWKTCRPIVLPKYLWCYDIVGKIYDKITKYYYKILLQNKLQNMCYPLYAGKRRERERAMILL